MGRAGDVSGDDSKEPRLSDRGRGTRAIAASAERPTEAAEPDAEEEAATGAVVPIDPAESMEGTGCTSEATSESKPDPGDTVEASEVGGRAADAGSSESSEADYSAGASCPAVTFPSCPEAEAPKKTR